MSGISLIIFISIWIGFVVLLSGVLFTRMYKKAPQGQALLRSGMGGRLVSQNAMLVFPIYHQLDFIDLKIKNINLEETIQTQDEIDINIQMLFSVQVNPVPEDIKYAASNFGPKNTFDEKKIYETFAPKFKAGLRKIGSQFTLEMIQKDEDQFFSELMSLIEGDELHGFTIASANILQIKPKD